MTRRPSAFSHETGSAESGQMLRDGGLGNVEACRQVLDRGLSPAETFENSALARVGQSAEDGVLTLHENTYKQVLIEYETRPGDLSIPGLPDRRSAQSPTNS